MGAVLDLPCAMIVFGAIFFASSMRQIRAAPNATVAEDITLDETDDSYYIIMWTVAGVIICCSALGLVSCICWRNAKARERLEEEASLSMDLKEWYYVKDGEVVGPFSAYTMRVRFRMHDFDKETLCKLVWQDQFVPVSQLFPDSGTEFNMEPRLTDDDAHTDWHRHSVLALPSDGKPAPAISWFYNIDGQVYGPFEMGKMKHWSIEKHFAANTLVRIGDPNGPFKPIQDFYPNLEKAFDGIPQIPEGMSVNALPDTSDRGKGSFYAPGSGSGLALPPVPPAETVGKSVEFEENVESVPAPEGKKKKKKVREGEESGDGSKKKKGMKKKKPREDGSGPEEVSAGHD